MERDPSEASDYGRDDARDLGDEPPGELPRHGARHPRPDRRYGARSRATSPPPEHRRTVDRRLARADWEAARPLIFPLLRPPGRQGLVVAEIDPAALAADAARSHSQPLVDEGPCRPVGRLRRCPRGGFDVIVNGDHLLSWGVTIATIQEAALRNLAAWSATAAWTDEVSGERRLISSDTGDGWDAARILLPGRRRRSSRPSWAASGRVLIGLPERHLLVAGALRPGDEEFGGLFAEFVVEASGGADEPVDRRVFELVDGRLVEAAGLATPA